MPAEHIIDDENKLITTIWSGEATDAELIAALSVYQRDIIDRFGDHSYNEILDLSKADGFMLTVEGIKQLAHIAVKTDRQGAKSKLAIIVTRTHVYGLGRMYEIYRSLLPGGHKEVRVYKNYSDALEWIEDRTDS